MINDFIGSCDDTANSYVGGCDVATDDYVGICYGTSDDYVGRGYDVMTDDYVVVEFPPKRNFFNAGNISTAASIESMGDSGVFEVSCRCCYYYYCCCCYCGSFSWF